MYIEPCCIDSQLPKLLREHPMVFFQSNGDWNVSKLMKAVACMVDGHDILLALPEVDIDLLRFLYYWFGRGWINHLSLITTNDQSDLIRQELPDRLKNISYCYDWLIIDSLICLYGEKNSLVIQGPMLLKTDYSLSLYSAYFGKDNNMVSQAVEPFESKLRIKQNPLS